MKCTLCKRRNFTEQDEDCFKATGRCMKCDIRIHREDILKDSQGATGMDGKMAFDLSKNYERRWLRQETNMEIQIAKRGGNTK